MNILLFLILNAIIIFSATSIGATLILLFRKTNSNTLIVANSLAAGIMFAASIWSLIIPSLEKYNYLYILIGLVLGIIIIFILDLITERNTFNNLFFLAILIHNIPEGIAVGIMSIYSFYNHSIIPALLFTIGIAIQNFPEGFSISYYYYNKGYSLWKSICYGIISGSVEPIFCIFMLLIYNYINPFLPIVFSLAASLMIYVVVRELINNSRLGTIIFLVGFIIMMSLDIIF